jgi:hypothetical protein
MLRGLYGLRIVVELSQVNYTATTSLIASSTAVAGGGLLVEVELMISAVGTLARATSSFFLLTS